MSIWLAFDEKKKDTYLLRSLPTQIHSSKFLPMNFRTYSLVVNLHLILFLISSFVCSSSPFLCVLSPCLCCALSLNIAHRLISIQWNISQRTKFTFLSVERISRDTIAPHYYQRQAPQQHRTHTATTTTTLLWSHRNCFSISFNFFVLLFFLFTFFLHR